MLLWFGIHVFGLFVLCLVGILPILTTCLRRHFAGATAHDIAVDIIRMSIPKPVNYWGMSVIDMYRHWRSIQAFNDRKKA